MGMPARGGSVTWFSSGSRRPYDWVDAKEQSSFPVVSLARSSDDCFVPFNGLAERPADFFGAKSVNQNM